MNEKILLATRNVAEYAYCPRLFYFMEVEGIKIDNVHIVLGQVVHKHVDEPSKFKKKPSVMTEPIAAECNMNTPEIIRSLVLTDEKLGLTATLDLVELNGNIAVPIEYRKGEPKYIYSEIQSGTGYSKPIGYEPWPIDKIQLGLQSILLESAGYVVSEAELYYAEIRKRLKFSMSDAIKQDALNCFIAAKNCMGEQRPAPLINDSRCLGCSLQPICIPDEINQINDVVNKQDTNYKRMWPPRSDGFNLVVQSNASKLGVSGECLKIKHRDQKNIELPICNVESVALLGSVQISTQAVHTLSSYNIPIAFLSPAGKLKAIIEPADGIVSAITKKAQVRIFDSNEKCLEIATALVLAKITNQRTLLMRNAYNLGDDVLKKISNCKSLVKVAKDINELRGYEGMVASLYFSNFNKILKFEFGNLFEENGRKRRPPSDPVNCCLSFAYTMLANECITALRLASLEPTIGCYHVSRPGRPSLALDLMEPFRPIIADSITISAFNREELQEKHFYNTAAGCMFTDSGKKNFFEIYNRRLCEEITHPLLGYKLSYRRMLYLHARLISAWILNEIKTLTFLTTR